MLAPEAYIEGFDMLSLGGYPGLIPGKGRIRGEVHEYEHLDTLDSIEGYLANVPERGLYDRTQVTVDTPEGNIEGCWVYIYNDNRGPARHGPIIESGDWFEHRGLYEKLGTKTV